MSMKKMWLYILLILISIIGLCCFVSALENNSIEKSASSAGTSAEGTRTVFTLSNSAPPEVFSHPYPLQGILNTMNATIIPVPVSFGPYGINRIETIVPNHWRKGFRVGTFFDPVLGITWIYDRTLQTCFSPEKGWVLVTEYSSDNIPLAQFYYDIEKGTLFDRYTGKSVMGQSIGSNNQMETTISPLHTPKQIESADESTSGQQGQLSDKCITACSICPSGYCHDCNKNGVCDEEETGTSTSSAIPSPSLNPHIETTTPVITPVSTLKPSYSPQISPEQTQIPYPHPGSTNTITQTPVPTFTRSLIPNPTQPSISEQNQAQVQIKLIPDIFHTDKTGIQDEHDEISEAPQSTIYHYKILTGKGPFKVIECPSGGRCVFCIDENDNHICDTSECYLIRCNDSDSCNYCIDCNRDLSCDLDKFLILSCDPDESCNEVDYCDDYNQNFRCDSEENTEDMEDVSSYDPLFSDWSSIIWEE